MKNSICIVTFISGKEQFEYKFVNLVEYIRNKFNNEVQAIIYADSAIDGLPTYFEEVITPHYTKYKRIQDLLQRAKGNKIFCIDSDISIHYKNFEQFLNTCIEGSYALAWGKIESVFQKNIVSGLVCIDKMVSHSWIRPFLWSHHIGVSLPGQVFMIDKSFFRDKLEISDTVFDDLTLGIVSQIYKFPVYYSNLILGCENPKSTYKGLIEQRQRWAKGYAESLCFYKKSKVFHLVLIHGVAYHLLWIPLWLFFISFAIYNIFEAFIVFVIASLIIAKLNLAKSLFVMIYCLVFPFLHVIWAIEVFINYQKLV